MSKPKIVLSDISKIYLTGKGKVVPAVEHVNLEVPSEDFVCIVGVSGCGKSTLLNLIAGLSFPTEGSITMDGKKVTGPGARAGMAFQGDLGFPLVNRARTSSLGRS
jgi:NitT/TauT family transport system ATP-binding protein